MDQRSSACGAGRHPSMRAWSGSSLRVPGQARHVLAPVGGGRRWNGGARGWWGRRHRTGRADVLVAGHAAIPPGLGVRKDDAASRALVQGCRGERAGPIAVDHAAVARRAAEPAAVDRGVHHGYCTSIHISSSGCRGHSDRHPSVLRGTVHARRRSAPGGKPRRDRRSPRAVRRHGAGPCGDGTVQAHAVGRGRGRRLDAVPEVVSAAEARWVVRRLAELLDWDAPAESG